MISADALMRCAGVVCVQLVLGLSSAACDKTADRSRAEADVARLHADRSGEQAARANAEAERAKTEAERARQDAIRAQYEAERAKAEAERAKAEVERALAQVKLEVGAHRDTTTGTPHRLSDKLRASYPDLESLIEHTESMSAEERAYWYQTLPTMTDAQVEKFRSILLKEQDDIAKLDKDYEKAKTKARSEFAGGKPRRLPDKVRARYPDLEDLIDHSESMDEGDRAYWYNLIPDMTDAQIEKVRNILIDERKGRTH